MKGVQYFIVLVMIIIILMTVFTFILTFSFFPHDEPAPKRSRPVVKQETYFRGCCKKPNIKKQFQNYLWATVE
ncbi:MAG: hypothetical protein GX996_06455 [Firmicutes bacterium]|nr:hypothetical protein [Bacillota bacterium]